MKSSQVIITDTNTKNWQLQHYPTKQEPSSFQHLYVFGEVVDHVSTAVTLTPHLQFPALARLCGLVTVRGILAATLRARQCSRVTNPGPSATPIPSRHTPGQTGSLCDALLTLSRPLLYLTSPSRLSGLQEDFDQVASAVGRTPASPSPLCPADSVSRGACVCRCIVTRRCSTLPVRSRSFPHGAELLTCRIRPFEHQYNST